MANIANIYTALANAETGGEENPWIRTKSIPVGGSSAFGPVQITKGLIEDAIARKRLSPGSTQFASNVMLPIQELFLRYGNVKNLTPEQAVYDYGGTGNFNVDEYGDDYMQLASELIQMKLKESKNDVDKFLKAWRGIEPEKTYKKRFDKKFKKTHYQKDE